MNSMLPLIPALIGLLTIGILMDYKYSHRVPGHQATTMNYVGSFVAHLCAGLAVALIAMVILRYFDLIPPTL